MSMFGSLESLLRRSIERVKLTGQLNPRRTGVERKPDKVKPQLWIAEKAK